MRRVVVLLAAFAAICAVAPITPRHWTAAEPARAAGATPSTSPTSAEVVDLRSQYSRTYLEDGHYVAHISLDSVNYKDATGSWQPIDDSLVPSSATGYAYQNKANRYTAFFPSDLSAAPIKFQTPSGWVQFQLLGASGAGAVSGDTDTYRLPGGSISWAAGNDTLKESITLDSATSPATYAFSLQAASGLSLQKNSSGGMDVLDGAKRLLFSLAPPTMQDQSGASHAVSMSVASTATGYTVTLSADPAWLADPGRKYPVVIDPSLSVGTSQECDEIDGAHATTSVCNSTKMYIGNWGYNGYSTYPTRALLQFNLSSIPTGSHIVSADLGLFCLTAYSAYMVYAYALTQSWTTAASWALRDGTNPWTTSDGAYASGGAYTTANGVGIVPTSANDDTVVHWSPTDIVQSWVNGTLSNHGFLLRASDEVHAADEFSTTVFSYNHPPTLTVTYTAPWSPSRNFASGSGAAPWETFDGTSTAAASLDVNVANGNLLASAGGLSIPGVNGLGVSVDAAYNSTSRGAMTDLGYGWTLGTGRDVGLSLGSTQSIFYDGTGHAWAFPYNSSTNTFASPAGIDADLVKNGDGTFTLTDHASHFQLKFNSVGYLTSEINREGNTVSFSYDASNRLSSIRNSDGRVTTLAYANSTYPSNITSITSPNSRVWSYAYDSTGNLQSVTDPKNQVTQFGYDSSHDLTSVTDPNGNVASITYTLSGGSPTVKPATIQKDSLHPGRAWSFDFTANPTVVTDPNGHMTKYTYDASNRVTQLTYPDATSSAYTWTSDNQVATDTPPSGHATTYSYDSLNNLTRVTAGTGASVSWTYNNASQPYPPDSSTDDLGNVTNYSYTTGGLLQTITEPLVPPDTARHTVSYAYNTNGTLASVTDENGHQTTYGYTAAGFLNSATPPSPLGGWSGTYNADNLLAAETDGKNQTTTYTYDAVGQLTQEKFADNSTIGYAYDANGNLTSYTDPGTGGTTSYTYNALDQVTKKTLPNGNTISYTWDGVDNLLTKTDAAGTTTYGYTVKDEVNSVSDPLTNPNGTPPVNPITLSYDSNGNLQTVNYPNGVTQTLSYDNADQLTSISAAKGLSTLTSFSYSYANPNNGNAQTMTRFSMTDGVSGHTTSYSYDPLGRLTQAQEKDSLGGVVNTWQYGFDPASNLTSTTVNGTTTSYGVNAADELTTPNGTPTYSYDANGNLTGVSGGNSLAYNAQDQTTSMTPNGGSAIAMGYTGDGQSERIANGPTSYQYDETGLGAMTAGGNTTSFTTTPDGMVLAERIPAGATGCTGSSTLCAYYYLYDGQSSVVGLTDASGTLVNSYRYDPYGNATSVTEGVPNPFRYIGAVWDSSTELYQMGERYYDPSTARFTQEDPLGGGYGYSDGDPINYSDPSGLSTTCTEGAECGGGAYMGGEGDTGGGDEGTPEDEGTKCSFSSDTQVLTKTGEKPISDVQVGDQVLGYDPKTGKTAWYSVTAVLKHRDQVLELLTVNGERIVTTPNHPFFTREHGWVPADQLTAGERVRQADGGYGTEQSLTLVHSSRFMYNLTVAYVHDYFVGSGRWLVHNSCREERTKSQRARRRLARRKLRIPRNRQPCAQFHSPAGSWWEYINDSGQRKIVVQHPDGTVHGGRPKPQSAHRTGGPPKYYDECGGHVGE